MSYEETEIFKMSYSDVLLDDLINKYVKDNDLKSLKEIERRVKFCGFND